MKKIISLIMAFVMVISLSACSSAEPTYSKYLGTWAVVSLEAEGVTFTVDELKALGEDEMADFIIIIKDGGKAFVSVDGDSDLLDWVETESGVKIGQGNCSYLDGVLTLENNGYKINFEKTSDSQIIENKQQEEKIVASDVQFEDKTSIEIIEENDNLEGIRPEFKEAMDSYEAFFDEYVAFMERYAEADTTEMLNLLSDYTKYMTEYAEAMNRLTELEEQDMSIDEAIYYMEVTSRITEKLWEIEY